MKNILSLNQREKDIFTNLTRLGMNSNSLIHNDEVFQHLGVLLSTICLALVIFLL
jgi:hypothetical protein